MRLVTGLLAPFQLELARTALDAAGANGMTVTPAEVTGAGVRQVYRGREVPQPLARLRIEVLAAEADVTAVVKALCVAARSGGDPYGQVWVTPVQSLVRVRTRQRGTAAL
jgi:nitrogen regulatory protein PII